MDIFVGNIPEPMTEAILKELFQEHGTVLRARIIKDKEIAFVGMPYENEALEAISFFNGLEVYGNRLVVRKAKTEAKKPRVFISRAWQEKAKFQDY